MPLTKKITDLLSKKYNSNISILGNYTSSTYTSILDNDNGTIFIVSDSDLYSFKDQDRNLWVNVTDSFHSDGKEHHPEMGKSYNLDHGVQYSFTTKEAIVEMAASYFENHKYDIT